MRIVTLLSGGMDSSVLLFHLLNQHEEGRVHALSFDYGQRHSIELASAVEVFSIATERYGDTFEMDHHIINLTSVTALLTGSSLTDMSVAVPDGHYTDETMKATVVPNRNMMMLSIGAAVAVAEHAEVLAFAAHAGDHAIYPDCRPGFVGALDLTTKMANAGFIEPTFALMAPFINWDKGQIAARGLELGVPFEKTWTCYNGKVPACGTCGTCVERREAFSQVGFKDPIPYAS
jgi:7-cyano-7-deazaguanine synthase